jgi:hypothetical protein
MSVQKISFTVFSGGGCGDEEQKRIAAKLREYGVIPTGDKTTDKATLYRIELEKAKQENCVTNKFLTVSKAEQEKIQAKKKEKQKNLNPDINKDIKPEEFKGSKALGQQLLLAIEMRRKKDKTNFS